MTVTIPIELIRVIFSIILIILIISPQIIVEIFNDKIETNFSSAYCLGLCVGAGMWMLASELSKYGI